MDARGARRRGRCEQRADRHRTRRDGERRANRQDRRRRALPVARADTGVPPPRHVRGARAVRQRRVRADEHGDGQDAGRDGGDEQRRRRPPAEIAGCDVGRRDVERDRGCRERGCDEPQRAPRRVRRDAAQRGARDQQLQP
jgi:hypothetical protein